MQRPHALFTLALLPAALSIPVYAQQAETAIAEIVVTADLRGSEQIDIPASVSIYNQVDLQRQSISHLEQVIAQTPNMNFASGASRGRFLQIRGIGERGQFIEPVNYSVGVLVDGIDFTGISTAITSLDVQQIEILRGPQGTVYGANALAGLVNVRSNPVADEFAAEIAGQFGEYDTANLSGVVNLPLADGLGLRLAAQQNNSDGYRDNAYLNRDDTNELDETNLRATLHWQASRALSFNWTTFYADVDNGYDGFSLDNTWETYSDQPGRDTQETVATSLTAQYELDNGGKLIGSFSTADSDIEYSYDEDWVYVGICENTACDFDLWGFDWEYSSFDQYLRDNHNNALDLRFISGPGDTQWVAGFYYRDQTEELERVYTYASDNFISEFDTENLAVYGEIQQAVSDQLSVTFGLRWESQEANYSDNTDVALDSDDDTWGGKLALSFQMNDDHTLYGVLSRGYKFGSFNPNDAIAPEFRQYDPEYLNNYEIGLKSNLAGGRVFAQVALFWQDREDVQISTSEVNCAPAGFPCTFDDYLNNAGKGATYGLEAQIDAQLNNIVTLYGSLGLMESEYKDYISFNHVDADPENNIGVNLDGHELPQAPSYTFTVGTEVAFTDNLLLDISVIGKDEYFYSNDHEYKTDAQELLNARLVYSADNWEIGLWGRNITDEETTVRGFGTFPNDPRKLYAENELYVQYGEPRVLGISAKYTFN
ncbi:TonB-dependent receptor [Halioxenophilus aromaticivorans]|uniref:TonB-dependent receptor n=1 Tax=Halioxenophilus aromaticivorans TaxID=1306992 RepID=A0AAV3U9W8_9ALTE